MLSIKYFFLRKKERKLKFWFWEKKLLDYISGFTISYWWKNLLIYVEYLLQVFFNYNQNKSIYILSDCLYVCTYQTAGPISTKFCTDLHTNSGKVLNTSMTTPTQPLDPGVPQTPKPKWITGEKTLCNVKCPDGWCKLIKFFLGSAGARLASHS